VNVNLGLRRSFDIMVFCTLAGHSMVLAVSRLWAAAVGALGFVVVLPVVVLAGSSLGVPTVHWSGVTLSSAELLPFSDGVEQGSRDRLDAARLAHLDSVQHAAIDRPHAGLVMTYTSFARDKVVVETTALSHGLFADLGDRFGGDVTVVYSPLQPVMSTMDLPRGVPRAVPSWWQRHEPLATWWLLVTGFPWYLGAATLVELGVVLLRRHGDSGMGLARASGGRRPARVSAEARTLGRARSTSIGRIPR